MMDQNKSSQNVPPDDSGTGQGPTSPDQQPQGRRPPPALTSSSTDREVLAWLAYRLECEEGVAFSGWSSPANPAGEVESLQIMDPVSVRQLPAEIGRLKHVRRLTLINQRELTSLPPEIGSLTSLEYLDLRNCGLTSLPPEIGQCQNLFVLEIFGSLLEHLPPTIGQLGRLGGLWLMDSRLVQLPDEIGQLTHLHALWVDGNQLMTLPRTVGQLARLESLHASRNQLSTLPAELGQCHALLSLDLHQNHLTRLPPTIGRLTKLTTLFLADNYLADLPPEIAQMSQLEDCNLRNNQLTRLPEELTRLTQLWRLDLEGNPLVTPIPAELDRVSNIRFPIGDYIDAQGTIREPLRVLYEEVMVDFYRFGVIDLGGRSPDDLPLPGFEWPEQGCAVPFANYVLLVSGGQHHYPWIRMEAWEQDPPQVPGVWDEVCEVVFLSSSGILHLIDVYDEVYPREFTLGEANQNYHLRIWYRRQKERLDSGQAVRGAEHYVFQFWPSLAIAGKSEQSAVS